MLPIVLALTVCDDIWIDANTRKQTVLGIYGSVAAGVFPHTLPQLAVYVCLTECPPQSKIKVKIVDVDEDREPVWTAEHEIISPDIRATLQGAFRARRITFPEPGEYRVQLFSDDEILLERRLILLKIGGLL